MDEVARLNWLVPLLAFALAAIFGAIAQRFNFCTMGAIADVVNFGDWRRMRMWLLAILVAITGTTLLASSGLIDLSTFSYDGNRSGANGSRSGSSRPQVGGMSGGGRGEPESGLTGLGGDFGPFSRKNTDTGAGEESPVVIAATGGRC